MHEWFSCLRCESNYSDRTAWLLDIQNCMLYTFFPNLMSKYNLHHNPIKHVILKLQVNERAGQIIQYDKFYIHELEDLVDIRSDYVTWIQHQMFSMVSSCFLFIT